ncbi:methyltransferase-like protein 13 isoform X1 [Ananas comosus]|uniref:Methyltransferase-like protein 13 isoform X1 n=1 Tax=Ananas comosus TaxID=4615 RepID=A0A6P5EVW6_ANACO|nr:methyltransferase-like protein 13 isoform X1 [Ananas comosus]
MTLGGSSSSSSSSSSLGTHSYGETAYWDDRYRKDGGPFDWYQKYAPLSPLFDLYLRRSHRLLLVGCGNSVLGESMVDDGYQDIINIDISTVVIEAMQQKYKDKPALKYLKMDVRDMAGFESNSFDGVIDKGTLDSIMCGHNAHENATKMLEEVARVLKDKGVYILITYGDPSYRLCVLKNLDTWTINMHVIDRLDRSPEQKSWELTKPLRLNEDGTSVAALLGSNPDVHYIYVCIKDESLRQKRNNNRVDREAKVG